MKKIILFFSIQFTKFITGFFPPCYVGKVFTLEVNLLSSESFLTSRNHFLSDYDE